MNAANECPGSGTLTADETLTKASEKRIKNATEALQKYIEEFTNVEQTKPTATPISCCYGSSNGSLLSTKPESFSSAKKHSKKITTSAEKQKRMADNLVQWVNESYSKDLQRRIVPFGQRRSSSVDTNGPSQTEENGGSNDDDEVSTLSDGDTQVSTLPSPGTSVVSDLDSNVGSVNTDVLLSSFYRHDKNMNHPSWVEELVSTKHYPSWIDDVDVSHAGHQHVSHHQRNRLSRSLSPSFFRELSSPNSTTFQSTSLQEKPKKISDPKQKKSKAWDLESTDTEALISESIYGPQPVNMGGSFHQSLYIDKKIQQLRNCGVRKIAKDSERSLMKEMSFAYVEDSMRSENKPTQWSTKPRKTANPKTPVNKQHKKTSGQLMETPKSLQHARKSQNITEDHLKPQNFGKNVNSNTSKPLSLNLGKEEVRKNSTGSSNTDRLMRQSPTGIKMEKQNSRSRTIENSTRKAGMTDHIQDRTSTHFDHSQKVMASVQRQHLLTPSNSRTSQRGISNVRYASKNVHTSSSSPRRNASEELQRIIDKAESSEGQKNDHYLSGKVSKKYLPERDRKRIFNNDRINSWKGSNTKRTELSYSTNGNLNGSYFPRKDLRSFSLRGLPPSDRYHGRISENRDSDPYGEKSPRRKFPWNSDPTKLAVAATTSNHDFRSRSRTKSAPGMKADLHTRIILPEHEERCREGEKTQRRVTRTHMKHADKTNALAATYTNADYANEQNVSPDELESVDTEALIIKPPMPLFDASPSLTTESVESTLGSEEGGDTLIENLALRTSLLATELHSSSETSYLEFKMSPRHHEIDQNLEDENLSKARLTAKPGIITSFLDDCMRSSDESRSDIHVSNGKLPRSFIENEQESAMSEETSSERPVETLKKMLFTVQRLAHSSEEEDHGENDQLLETPSEVLTEGVLSDILSTASHNEGQDSLSRAYYHLARLKRLVSASKEVAAWK